MRVKEANAWKTLAQGLTFNKHDKYEQLWAAAPWDKNHLNVQIGNATHLSSNLSGLYHLLVVCLWSAPFLCSTTAPLLPTTFKGEYSSEDLPMDFSSHSTHSKQSPPPMFSTPAYINDNYQSLELTLPSEL